MQTPREVVRTWVDALNRADVEGLAALCAENMISRQVVQDPVVGRAAIRMVLKWRDPRGLRGCGFFNVVEGRIRFQRGYRDRLSFLRQRGQAIPGEQAPKPPASAGAVPAPRGGSRPAGVRHFPPATGALSARPSFWSFGAITN
jgi:hypothetical protein